MEVEFAISTRASGLCFETLQRLTCAGLRHVYLGVESGAEKDLQWFNKELTVEDNVRALHLLGDLGVSVQAGTIILHPRSTTETIRETYDLLRATGHHGLLTQATYWHPYHGSALAHWALCKEIAIATLKGTVFTLQYPQQWQTELKILFIRLQKEFLPFYKAIAKYTGARTYLWRKRRADCPEEILKALEAFEKRLNDVTDGLLVQALDIIDQMNARKFDRDDFAAETAKASGQIVEEMNRTLFLILSAMVIEE